MTGIVDSIRDMGALVLIISITALLATAIAVFLIIRSKRNRSLIQEEAETGYAAPMTTNELTLCAKEQLLKLLKGIDEQKFREAHETIDGYLTRIDENFLLVVFGEFNAGKSSFINAFLGEEMLATGIIPTTVTINRICYGDTVKQEIIFRDGHIEVVSDEDLPDSYPGDEESLQRVDYISFFRPSTKLRNVDIIDTPGLNSLSAYHEQTALNFVQKADAVVWLFHPHQGGTQSEKEYLKKFKEYGKNIIGVMSHKDIIDSDEDIAKLEDFIGDNFGNLVDRLFTVSSRQAIQSISSGDDEGYMESGLPEIEKYLQERIFNRVKRAKIECAVVSSEKSALYVSNSIREELEQLREIERYWDLIGQIVAQEHSSINKDIYRKVLASVKGHFEEHRMLARQKIAKIFSWKEILFTLCFAKGEVTFPIDEEFFGMLNRQALESSVRAVTQFLKKRTDESFKAVGMELMIENQKRRRSGLRLLGTETIRIGEEVLGPSFFENSEHHCREVLDHEASVKVFSAQISFRRFCATAGRSFSEARRQVEKEVYEYTSHMERDYLRCVMNRWFMMNREVTNKLLEYLAPHILGGIKDIEEFRSMVNFSKEKAGAIDDIADNLRRLRTTCSLQ